jgi:hypothetical protein
VPPLRVFATLALLSTFWPLPAGAQAPPAATLAEGVLLERDAPGLEGQFSIRADSNQVFRYRFNSATYVVRDGRLTSVPSLNPGETVEVISDSVESLQLRYARDVHVVSEGPPVPRARPAMAVANRLLTGFDPLERSLLGSPVGNLTFAGVVYRVTGERVVLHTRIGDQAILLRRDTRYVHDGASVDFASLKPNLRVFVRGGKDLWDQVEAYQVFWGEILQPR